MTPNAEKIATTSVFVTLNIKNDDNLDDKSEIQKVNASSDTVEVMSGDLPNKTETQKACSCSNVLENQPEQIPLTVAVISFKIDEVVWAKIKGHVHWPAKIKSFANSKMVIVVWFNDYRTTKIYRTQLFKFLNNFDEFAKRFDDTVGLKKAALEALSYYGTSVLNK